MSKTPLIIPIKNDVASHYSEKLTQSNYALVFDIDNTLYCESSGLSCFIKKQIYAYAASKNIPKEKIKDVCTNYSKQYGLALKGFLKNHPDTDPVEFDSLVDGIADLDSYLSKNDTLKAMIECFNVPLYCFTNANYKHAIRVLKTLGIYECFDAIFYCEYTKCGDFLCKPDIKAYELVQQMIGKDTSVCFFDDSVANVEVGKSFGWKCYKVDSNNNIEMCIRHFIQTTGYKYLAHRHQELFKNDLAIYIANSTLISKDELAK